jgi:uncharacterized oligopeptide transporter (OPT) family protein
MAIKQLTEDQTRTMSVEEKDRWWLENVYQGDVRQMTARVVLMGFLLGGLLSITNLYVGAKAGWSLGVAITSVILAFVFFKSLEKIGFVRQYHVLESNILQSIACSAGYMNGPLIASMAAYMVITNTVIPPWQMIMWLIGLAVLGVLFAFPLKRRFINDEQLPFPEGRAAGVVMDTLHSEGEDAAKSVLPAKLLVIFSVIAGVLRLGQSHAIMERIKLGFLAVPELLDAWYYRLAERAGGWIPTILNTPLRELTIRPSLDIAMIAAGGLMGIRTGVSLLIGAVINYWILAPLMIQAGDILGTVDSAGEFHIGFRAITTWSLWGGVAMMTTASLYSFFARPQMFLSAFRGLFAGHGERRVDCVKHIEFPLWVSLIGVPLAGAYLVWIAHWFFGVRIWLGIVAVPLVFIFTLIGVNSTALTSITPTGALGKITQLVYAGLAPGNITTNIATAGIGAEVAGGASNLIQNIKPGYMLGGKPRLQAIGHVIGAFSGAIFSVAVFYPLFLRNNPAGLITPEYPYPAVTVWKAVAELLTKGLDELSLTALWAVIIGASLGIVFEIIRAASKGKFPFSAVGIGLAFVIPFDICLAMFMGSFVFWVISRIWPRPEQRPNQIFVQNQESICAGGIAGAALVGVAVMALELFVL